MSAERTERRLAAILAADMVGYGRLMEVDEAGTIARQKAHRAELIDPKIAEHKGRIVKTMGDGLLVEFASAVDAVACAAEIQRTIAEREVDIPVERRIAYRVGVNIGDIVTDGDDILGDGVNVAARLEALAEAGGVCVSGTVHEHVAGKLDLAFADMGEQRVKNIERPIQAFRVVIDGAGATSTHRSTVEEIMVRPAIAVLPFDNMSGDPDQEYFSDGITEDIVTELSKSRLFPVIARNSTFAFKGEAHDVRRIAGELDARYVVEGSVRKAGDRVRITAQLIDATSGRHLWAERYDRALDDIFAVQDDITLRIAGALAPRVAEAEERRALRKPLSNLDAWDSFLRGVSHFQRFTRDDFAAARDYFEGAIRRDADMAAAHSYLAIVHTLSVFFSWIDSPIAAISLIQEHAARALALDDSETLAHVAMSWAMFFVQRYDEARAEGEAAIAINPSSASANFSLGTIDMVCGRHETAISSFENANRLSPRDPLTFFVENNMGLAHYLLGRYEEATEWLKKAIRHKPDFLFPHFNLAAAYGQLGQQDLARAALARGCEVQPAPTKEFFRSGWRLTGPGDFDRMMEGLYKAGLPE